MVVYESFFSFFEAYNRNEEIVFQIILQKTIIK